MYFYWIRLPSFRQYYTTDQHVFKHGQPSRQSNAMRNTHLKILLLDFHSWSFNYVYPVVKKWKNSRHTAVLFPTSFSITLKECFSIFSVTYINVCFRLFLVKHSQNMIYWGWLHTSLTLFRKKKTLFCACLVCISWCQLVWDFNK